MSARARVSICLFALIPVGCVEAVFRDGGSLADGGVVEAGIDAGSVTHACESHLECIASPDPEAYLCFDRGEGRRCHAPPCRAGECEGHPLGNICQSFGLCGCTSDDDCPEPVFFPYCAPMGTCGNCRTEGDCSAPTPHCDPQWGLCNECLEDAHCAGGDCNTDTGECG